jgi:hypothetical protein
LVRLAAIGFFERLADVFLDGFLSGCLTGFRLIQNDAAAVFIIS